VSPRPPDGDDLLETRVHDLEMEMSTLQQELHDAATIIHSLDREVKSLRARLAPLAPERHYCPKCRALVHKDARHCSQCSHTWGTQPDPKKGLPT